MKKALLIIDVINHFEFPAGTRLLAQSMAIAPRIARLKARAQRAGVPVIYVNDNFGQWRSDASKILKYCLRADAPGRDFVSQIRPTSQDYFVLKPMHSAFYQSPLETLLRSLETKILILCGIATHSCIVCTAHDAEMRDFKLVVPFDCCAARSRREHLQAIAHLKTISNAQVLRSTAIKLGARS
jgi:nicotinamidase-related amidase